MKKTAIIFTILFILSFQHAFSQSDTLLPQLMGYENFNVFVAEKLEYPIIAAENEISGIVEFTFVVDQKGCIGSIKIISSPDQALSDEVLRIMNKTKCKWIPGRINNQTADIEIKSKTVFKLEVAY